MCAQKQYELYAFGIRHVRKTQLYSRPPEQQQKCIIQYSPSALHLLFIDYWMPLNNMDYLRGDLMRTIASLAQK